ncbi:MAG: insulinase family protein [Bacteroidales bacterium]|nr:insulinase family protein [Bacteroidales bacterium]
MDTRKEDILRFSFKHSASPVAYCALSTKCGTRDEAPAYNGLAHFTEHMFFKGTAKRRANSINNVLESVGGELNAYTTKEETVLHSTVLKEDLPKAIDLLMELAFTSVFPQKELEKERDVILEEIVSYKDVPADAIYEHFEQLLFEGHPLQMQILGEKKSLMKINSEVMKEYNSRNFIPSNMAFTIVADCPQAKAMSLIKKSAEKYLGREIGIEIITEGDTGDSGKRNESLPQPLPNKIFHKSLSKKSHQAHCMVGTTAYTAYDSRRIALSILTNILGGPASGSRLNMALREKNGLVYSVEAVYTPYADTGIFSVYFGCDREDVDKCLSLIKKELDRIVENRLTPAALKAARKQLIGQLSIAQDNAEAQCLSMGKSLLMYGKISTFEQMRQRIESITAEELQQTAAEVLGWERMSTLIYN